MNVYTTITDDRDLINEFIILRSKVQDKFCQSFANIKDYDYLSDCPRQGIIEIEEQKWHFQRHGIGICFTEENSRKVIDIREDIFSHQQQLNSWELLQYFESTGVKYIRVDNNIFDINNEDNLNNLIKVINISDYSSSN